MAVLDVNLIGAMYTTRLAQYYLMKNKVEEQKAIIFLGSMGESPSMIYNPSLMARFSWSKWYIARFGVNIF